MSIYQCQYDIRRYTNLKAALYGICSNLSNTIDNTSNLKINISDKYLVNDGTTPIVARTKQVQSNIQSTYNYINGSVIPAIDSAINNLNKEIRRIEAEEIAQREQERKAKEATAKKMEIKNGNIIY